MRIVYASRVKENRTMDIATFKALSNDEKNKVFAELARPKIEKKNAYTLNELYAMNDIERFSILSDEEKQKVLNGERPLRNAKCEKTFTYKHIEKNFFSPDTIKYEEKTILVFESTMHDVFFIKIKGNEYEMVRSYHFRTGEEIGRDLYRTFLDVRRELVNMPTENF